MFLIGISGTILPYLVLIGCVLVFSMSMSGSTYAACENTESSNDQEKHLIYTSGDEVGFQETSIYYWSGFSSVDKCRKGCYNKQNLSEVDASSPAASFVIHEFKSLFAESLKGRPFAFRYYGLSPPFFS